MISTARKSHFSISTSDSLHYGTPFFNPYKYPVFSHFKQYSRGNILPDPAFIECTENGLATALLSRVTLCYFLGYLVDNYCPEILFFVLEAYYMRSHPGTIFYDYLASSAPLELNLPEFLRDKAFDAWLCSDPEECFDCVKPAVMALLENSWKEFLLDPSSQFLREKLFMSIHTFQDLSIAAQFVIELLNSRYFPATEETTTFTDEVAALLHSKLLHLLNSFFGGTLPPSLLTLLLHQKSQDQEDLTLISTPENFNVIDSPLSSPQKSYIMDTSFKDCVFKLSKSRFPSRNSRNLSLSDDENEVSEDCQSDSSLNCGSSMKNSGFEFFISDMPKYKKGPNWKSIWRWAFVDKPCRV